MANKSRRGQLRRGIEDLSSGCGCIPFVVLWGVLLFVATQLFGNSEWLVIAFVLVATPLGGVLAMLLVLKVLDDEMLSDWSIRDIAATYGAVVLKVGVVLGLAFAASLCS